MSVDRIIADHVLVVNSLRENSRREIEELARYCRVAIESDRTIFFLGNGGSAADSQHLAAEFVGRFVRERRGLPAISLTTNTSTLTAVANDYGFERVFARQVEALVRPGDVVVGLSTSGNSPNVLRALEQAKQIGAVTVGLTGRTGGKMAAVCDLCLRVPSEVTARIQEAHILIGHLVCELVDEEFGHV